MTKEEQNQIIKDAWVRNLRKADDIPENIGQTFAFWVRNKIMQVSMQLKEPAPQQQEQQQNNEKQQEEAS